MNKQPIIIADADAIIAQTNPADIHHQKAARLSEYFIKINAQVIYPVTAVIEATTHLQRVLSNTASAYETIQLMIGADAYVVEVTKKTLTDAFEYFSPKTSKKNTMFDCIIVAIAKAYKAEAIFSFDHFYKKRGFKLAEDLK